MQGVFVKRLGGTEGGSLGRWVVGMLFLIPFQGCVEERPPPDGGSSPASTVDSCPTGHRRPDRVRFGLVGFWGTRPQEEAFQPVSHYLSDRIGIPVVPVASSRYDELEAWIAQGQVDIALVPPLIYVKAKARTPCLRLLRTMVVGGSVHYSGYLVVRSGSPITEARDLAGRRIAFVEPSSASGYLFAKRWLERQGMDPDRHLVEAVFVGSHEAVIRAVLSGEVDAGATFQGALARARRIGLDTASLRILAITGRIPLDALVALSDLDPHWIARLDEALEGLNTANPEGRAALSHLVDVTGWARSDDRFYDEVRSVLDPSGGANGEAP